MLELTPQQTAVLKRLVNHGFRVVAFALYASAIGVCRKDCAALLTPVAGGGLRLVGAPCYLVEGNLSVRLTRGGKTWFVWKKNQVEATPERLAELERFVTDLALHLVPAA